MTQLFNESMLYGLVLWGNVLMNPNQRALYYDQSLKLCLFIFEAAHFPYAEHGFFDDAAAHFGDTFFTVFEGDRYFL